MLKVLLMIAPSVQDRGNFRGESLNLLGRILVGVVEKSWPEAKEDVIFSALNLALPIGEDDIEVEVCYSVSRDEHDTRKFFDPSADEKDKLVEVLTFVLGTMFDSIGISFSIRIKPVKSSVLCPAEQQT